MSVLSEVSRVDLENFQDGESAAPNGNALFSAESSQNMPVKEGRVIKKAKRLTKLSPRKDDYGSDGLSPTSPGVNNNAKLPLQFTKNSRKSRGLHGRGLPKKGGAGGKGVWGKIGSELEETGATNDVHDPNYDSDSQDAVQIVRTIPELNDKDFVKAVKPLLQEYLEHGDSKEVKEVLQELNIASKKHKLPEMAVSIALDRHDPQRELTSQLLSDLTGALLTQEEVAKGFDDLLDNINDLTLDTPDAPTLLGQFIARAVADDCLPSDFIEKYKGNIESQYIIDALEKAQILLTMKHGIAHLHNVWGVGGGNRPVKNLKNKIIELLQEYLNSGDVKEAERCLRDLDVPHFHHELVYEAAVIAIEESTDRAVTMMAQLLTAFNISNVVTPTCFVKGVKRLYDDMPDICLDVPAAYCLLERLGNKLHNAGVLNDALYKEMPVRGRKRFVSEGDGGKVKENGNANHH